MSLKLNKNLITLKCVLFLVFGALGSLHPFLPLHMSSIGLSRDESTTIAVIAPLVAVLGPLAAAPLADRLAGSAGSGKRNKTGRYLRIMIALCLVLAAVFYWLLLAIPAIIRQVPNTVFVCNPEGGYVLQDRCQTEDPCYTWSGQRGQVRVKNCIFSCNASTSYRLEATTTPPPPPPPPQDYRLISDAYFTDAAYGEVDGPTVLPEADLENVEDSVQDTKLGLKETVFPNPHICYRNETGTTICEVFTEFSRVSSFTISLLPNIIDLTGNASSPNEAEEGNVCRYPIDNYFQCRINAGSVVVTQKFCEPKVVCELHNPYDGLLKVSQCGYDNISFWLYVFIRPIADIFPAAALTLIAAAVVIATRETSTGRGDIGKQLAAGALGFALFAPILGGVFSGKMISCVICFTILVLLAVLILVFDNHMPLSPPEWWWHTRCGLLALPMSSVRKYKLEIAALGVVLLMLGIFWSAIDAFLPWHFANLSEGTSFKVGLTVTMGAVPAIFLFIFAEQIIDYCGHSNILIICFIVYIIHHIALILSETASVLLVFEVLEIFTLHLMWITAIMYLRHLVPRKFTACGQALPIIAHFCLGRSLGAFLGSCAYTEYPQNFKVVHKWFAIAATIIAIFYFVCYHFYLKPKCAAAPQLPPYPAPSVVQSTNSNGSYTPLRVYHNGRAKKGHFRY